MNSRIVDFLLVVVAFLLGALSHHAALAQDPPVSVEPVECPPCPPCAGAISPEAQKAIDLAREKIKASQLPVKTVEQ